MKDKRYDQLAKNLSCSYIAHHQGISLARAAKEAAGEPGPYWYLLAAQVERDMMAAMDKIGEGLAEQTT